MKKNMGSVDRLIRTLIALLIIILYAAKTITGVGGAILLIVAIVLLVTSAVGFCPAYLPMKCSTRKEAKDQ
jgi:fatty acid desaturase